MHAKSEELLSLRDGEPVAPEVHAHVEGCDDCGRELARLGRVRDDLRSLPAIEPDQSLWETIAVQSVGHAAGPRFSWASAAGVAASFLVALIVMTRVGPDHESVTEPPATAVAPVPATGVERLPPSADLVILSELQERSRRLESLRRNMPKRPQIVRFSTARTIADLEDRIALVDMRLNAAHDRGLTPAQQQALWRERVNLYDSLVRVEAARLQTAGY